MYSGTIVKCYGSGSNDDGRPTCLHYERCFTPFSDFCFPTGPAVSNVTLLFVSQWILQWAIKIFYMFYSDTL